MNVCMFEGNLTRDVELKDVGSSKVANFGIAVSRQFTKKDGTKDKETVFLDMEAWDKGGEVIAQYFKKGSPIMVRCSVKQDTWKDKETGQNRTKLKHRVEEFWFPKGGKKREDNNDTGNDAGSGGGDENPF